MTIPSLLFSIPYYLQVPSILRWFLNAFADNPPIVLFCHRILPPKYNFSILDEFYYHLGHPTVEEFVSQVKYISMHHSLVSLEDIVGYIGGFKILPPNPVAITFDDGYHDNYSLAFPVLKDYQCRAAFFLTTDFIDTGKIPFHDQIIYGLCHTRTKKLRMEGINIASCEYPLSTLNEKLKSFMAIQASFKSLPYEKRTAYVESLLTQLGVEIDITFSNNLMLSWEEINEMELSGHSFYAHTRSHPLLTSLNPGELEEEVLESKKVINEKLSVGNGIFCYPYGKRGEFDKDITQLLKDHGFNAACSAIHGLNRPGGDPYAIKRTAMISEPIGKFALRTSGLFEILKELQAKWKR